MPYPQALCTCCRCGCKFYARLHTQSCPACRRQVHVDWQCQYKRDRAAGRKMPTEFYAVLRPDGFPLVILAWPELVHRVEYAGRLCMTQSEAVMRLVLRGDRLELREERVIA